MSPLIGTSPKIQALREELEYLARSDAKVLITGESGVGKDVLAKMIHRRSRRQDRPLVAINCAGLPDSLLQSELFGHVKGSFTGAYRDKTGLLEQAHRGTILLDEVGDMSLRLQSLLLRFLETGEFQPVGGDKAGHCVDVRTIAATNRNLPQLVEAGDFRADLYYRLNVIHLVVPPLRERRADIPAFVSHFLSSIAAEYRVETPNLQPGVVDRLVEQDWPGNARQLRNLIERLVVRRRGATITLDDLADALATKTIVKPSPISGSSESSSVAERLFDRMVNDGESFWSVVYPLFMSRDLTRDTLRQLITRGLRQTRGNYRILAQSFNMHPNDYRRFLSLLRKHQCHVPSVEFRTVRAALKDEAGADRVAS